MDGKAGGMAALLEDGYLCSLLRLCAALMDSLVVDPRMCRKESVWRVVTTLCRAHVVRLAHLTIPPIYKAPGSPRAAKAEAAAAKAAAAPTAETMAEFQRRAPVAMACCRIATHVITGTKSVG